MPMPNLPLHAQNETKCPGRAYFDVDGDKELQKASNESSDFRQLTWRGDPNETGSDCTIVVVTSELNTATYYVHKSVICFGTRHSKYFAKHLLQTVVDTNKVPSTKVEVDQRDANNIPIFLDFVYRSSNQHQNGGAFHALSNETIETALSSLSSPSVITMSQSSGDESYALSEGDNITTENAVSLRHLGRKFENDALIRCVNKFIQKDLNFSTGPVYLYTAWEYQDERLVESAQRLCAENIAHIDIKALIRLPIHLFRVVVQSLETFEKENKELSLRLSEIVCRYLETHTKARSAALLLELTDPLLMPYIASEAAIGYTAIVKDLEPDDASRHWSSLVRLCRRCAKVVVREYGWSDFSVNAAVNEYLVHPHQKGKPNSKSPTVVPPSNVDSLLFATSFAAALEQAQEDYEDISSTYTDLSSLLAALHQSVSALEAVNQRKDDFIEKQRSTIASSQHEIFALKRQIDSLKRQPTALTSQRQYSPPMIHPRIQPQQRTESLHDPNVNVPSIHTTDQGSRQHYGSPLRPRQQYGSPLRSRQQPRPAPEQNGAFVHGGHDPQRQYPSPLRLQQQQEQLSQPPLLSISSPTPMARQRNQTVQSPIYQKVGVHQSNRQRHSPLFDQPSSNLEILSRPPRSVGPVYASQDDLPPDLLEMSTAYQNQNHPRDLISPTQVGTDVHVNKNRTRQELKTKSEMRSKSLLV